MRRILLVGLVVATLAPPSSGAGAAPLSGLKGGMSERNIYIGTMLSMGELDELKKLKLTKTLCTEFNMLSPGNAMKFDVIHPKEGVYDFERADRMWRVAETCGMRFTGTPLVWHWQNPDWLKRYDGRPEKLRAILKDHITTLVTHFRGKVKVWDVVNEAIEERDMVQDLWRRNLGPTYVDDAFKWARAADPSAKLYYNDFNADGMSGKGAGVYQWVKRWLKRGVPIDGVGIQSHGPLGSSSQEELIENMRRYARLGLDTRMSEIAVPIGPGNVPNLQAQAAKYRLLANACFSSGTRCRMFTVWGVSDRYYRPVAAWKTSCCGLLWDEGFKRKPAYYALKDALQQAS
ncbi:MAG: endo-1,4-beta-xylanase [Actinobacteria bacterium]|nr:endo-1,4-beta-xylanase [Actinomycetota bacterium]